jgi:hypothetical protein
MKAILGLIVSILFVALPFAGLSLVQANPNPIAGVVLPDSDTYPPIISISSFENGTFFGMRNISINVTVSIGESKTATSRLIKEVYYDSDWETNSTILKGPKIATDFDYIDQLDFIHHVNDSSLQFNTAIVNIPDGKHNVTFYAKEVGAYPLMEAFAIVNSASLHFAIDTIAPIISDLSVENTTYKNSDIPLSFNVNENVTQTSYCLDNQANVTINGNSTLTGLAEGMHSLVVYANDTAGNIGASNTVYFSAAPQGENPLSIIPIVLVIFLILAVVALVIHSKRKSKEDANK